MWFLRDGSGKSVIWLKPNQEVTIGKRNKNLPNTDPSMSRTHALVSNIGNSVIVQDSNSTHGTWVKKPNSDFKREKQISLEEGDQVRFGLLTVYTIAYVETFVSYSSVSSHDLNRLNLLCSKYDLSLRKDLGSDSLCLVTGGTTFSGKQALALVMQIPVVSLDWINAWDDVDSYSFEIPQFSSYPPAAIKVKNEVLDTDLWEINGKRKVIFENLDFILSGEKDNLEITSRVIEAAGGTASIQNITRSSVSNISQDAILVCEMPMIEWIKTKKLNIRALTQDDLGIAIMKGKFNLDDYLGQVLPAKSKNSFSALKAASFDLFEDSVMGLEENVSIKIEKNVFPGLQDPPLSLVKVNEKSKDELKKPSKTLDVYSLFDDGEPELKSNRISILDSKQIIPVEETTGNSLSRNMISRSKTKAKDVFDLFNDKLLNESSSCKQNQDQKLKITESESVKKVVKSAKKQAVLPSKQTINSSEPAASKKKLNIDSFFDSLLNMDDGLQSQDPSVRENSIEDSLKQNNDDILPNKEEKEGDCVPIGALKGQTTSLAERLGIRSTSKEEIIPSSLNISKNQTDIQEIIVPATPVKPISRPIIQQVIISKHDKSATVKIEPESSEIKVASSIRNQELINEALEKQRAGRRQDENEIEMTDSKKTYSRIIMSESLMINKPNSEVVINTKRFLSNRVKHASILPPKKPPIEMKMHYRHEINEEFLGKKQSRIKNSKKRNWPGFSSDDEKD